MPQACIIARKCDIISEIYHPFRQERISLKNPSFVSCLSRAASKALTSSAFVDCFISCPPVNSHA